jgi:hypothetical protein
MSNVDSLGRRKPSRRAARFTVGFNFEGDGLTFACRGGKAQDIFCDQAFARSLLASIRAKKVKVSE